MALATSSYSIKKDMTGDDLIELLYIKSGSQVTSQNSGIYYGGRRVSIYENIETWFNEKDDMNIVLRPLLKGGSSKRSRNEPKDKETPLAQTFSGKSSLKNSRRCWQFVPLWMKVMPTILLQCEHFKWLKPSFQNPKFINFRFQKSETKTSD